MPLYDYQCRSCGKVAEVRHGFNETHEAPCADCGGEMRRVFSPAGIVFKGSGFYVTDSRKSSESSTSKSGGTGKSDTPAAETTPSGDGAKTASAPPTSETSSSASPASGGSSTSESAA